ncbi:hypothetical protein FKM82_014892 [Ascaphus truei]
MGKVHANMQMRPAYQVRPQPSNMEHTKKQWPSFSRSWIVYLLDSIQEENGEGRGAKNPLRSNKSGHSNLATYKLPDCCQ